MRWFLRTPAPLATTTTVHSVDPSGLRNSKRSLAVFVGRRAWFVQQFFSQRKVTLLGETGTPLTEN